MNLEELITYMFKDLSRNEADRKFTKSDIRIIYKTFIKVLEERLEEESKVIQDFKKEIKINIPLIGRFNIVRQNAYIGKNPKTKENIKIKSNNRIYYSPYKSIKKAINK